MKRKFLLSLSLIAMLMCLFAISVSAMTGAGTETDPYIVETAEDFMEINNNLSAHYKLNADISVSSNTGAIVEGTFSGVFDGGNHTIDVNIVGATSGTNTYDALFGVVSGKIKNLIVTGTVTGSDKVAGVAGKIIGSANVDNCINYATVSGRKNTGGIVGLLNSKTATISNCANFGSINGTTPISSGLDVGGIVGCVWDSQGSIANLTDCYNAGAITGNGYNVGGICGQFQGTYIKNCFSSGYVVSTTGSNAYGAFFGKIANCNSYAIDGYFCTTDIKYAGEGASKCVVKNYIIESTGVAIYLGNGSGIRGEFHINESMFNSFCSLAGYGPSSIEYGAVVSTKNEVAALNGNLISQEAKESGKVIFAPAMKNGEKQYSYADAVKGDGYHSYRFALTGFEDTRYSYNMEFVVLGYILLTDAKGNQQVFYVNSVVSDRLASAVADTGLNAVSIVRVAEATLDDGDFEGNETALNTLNHIVSLKDFATKIEIDGVIGYGHKSATFTKSISSEDTVVFKISNTDAEELNAYLSNLIAGGYEKISENEINGVKFYIFKAGTKLINLTCSSDLSEAVISYETLTNLPANLTKPTFEKVTDPSITQIKLETSIAEGMSYVIQLSDGTFLIIDGGWCDSNENEADKLYNTLASLAGEGNDIVIAGWIFTHCHGDHIGTFNFFVDKYHDNVTIKQILYNFPADNDILNSGSSYMLDGSKQRYGYFKEVVATYLTDTEFVKLHSGYKFYYADAEIEIIQTLEDLYPSTVANYDFNSSSTIFTVTIAGQKMLFLGDVSDFGISRLNSVFGESLKSDFLQVAHHGLNNNGTVKNLYLNADAAYIFYPAPLSWYNSNKNASANFYLAVDSKTVKQIFISGVETVTLQLPYGGELFGGEKIHGVSFEPEVNRAEVARPQGDVKVPDAYFDLDLSSGTPTDKMGNTTVTAVGGYVTETTLVYKDQIVNATAFTGDRYENEYYMVLNFNDITSDEEWKNFVMSSATFEVFLKLNSIPNQTVAIMTSCNGGGVTLYLRRNGNQINFQMGTYNKNDMSDSSNYSGTIDMTQDGDFDPQGGVALHIVGSYDSTTNKMKLYINGILIGEADYGDGPFRGGAGKDYILGIGHNPQYPNEEISDYANYEIYEAKIYDVALTDEQVAQEYWNCIDNLFETEAENE